MKRGVPLALAAAAYVAVAWVVQPGFFDGIAPPAPYRWVSPPPQFQSSNQPPLPGHGTLKVASNGVVDPGTIFTGDGQASISFVPGSFEAPPDRSPISVEIRPTANFPQPSGITLVTNVYCFTASAPLSSGKQALITLRLSDQMPTPSTVYGYRDQGPWEDVGSTGSAAAFSISTRTSWLGCFAAGYPSNVRQTAQGARLGGGQALPIVVAGAIVVVILAGLPLALLRRRGSPAGPPPPGKRRSRR